MYTGDEIMVTLSVIVPVYNVKPYLERCLDSILDQDFSDLEIILVDDGSTDGSEKICDAYAQKDDRVSVLHKENQGQAIARNEGVKLAHGEWIAFVDSDDVLPENAISNMMTCRTEKTDVIVGRIAQFTETETELTLDQDDFSKVDLKNKTGAAAFAELLKYVPAPLWSPCRNYIRRAFWQEIAAEFPVGITSEDMHLLPRLQMAAGEIALCNEVVYLYRYARPNSTMTGKRLSRELCFFKVISFYKDFFAKNPQCQVAQQGLLKQFGNLQYSVICRIGLYNANEQKQIIAAALPHVDMMKNCIYARKWKVFFTLLGGRITYKLIACRHKGR